MRESKELICSKCGWLGTSKKCAKCGSGMVKPVAPKLVKSTKPKK